MLGPPPGQRRADPTRADRDACLRDRLLILELGAGSSDAAAWPLIGGNPNVAVPTSSLGRPHDVLAQSGSRGELLEAVDPRGDGQDLRLAGEHLLAQHTMDLVISLAAAVAEHVSEKSRSAA
jgi:hypothetical protein